MRIEADRKQILHACGRRCYQGSRWHSLIPYRDTPDKRSIPSDQFQKIGLWGHGPPCEPLPFSPQNVQPVAIDLGVGPYGQQVQPRNIPVDQALQSGQKLLLVPNPATLLRVIAVNLEQWPDVESAE